MDEDKTIKVLKQFFTISVAVFEMQHNISKAFGHEGLRSYMHFLHLQALEEVNRINPNMEKINNYLHIMEKETNNNNH